MEEIVEVSGGDLRCAINSLQVVCLQGVPKSKVSDTSKRKRKHGKSSLSVSSSASDRSTTTPGSQLLPAGVGVRNLPLDLFHSLGRVLYAKRGMGESDAALLPDGLKHHGRLPLTLKGGPDAVREHRSSMHGGSGLTRSTSAIGYGVYFT